MEQDAANFMRQLYRLLDFFPESDPLTIRLKEKTLVILEYLVTPNLSGGSYYALLCDALALDGNLKTAKGLGWIHGVNTLIIEKEISQLKDWLLPLAKKPLEIHSLPMPKPEKKEKKYSKRQQKILAIMADREKTQVSDIAKQLGSVTKRTIRRDIDELLGQSKIVRFGEFNQVFYKIGQK